MLCFKQGKLYLSQVQGWVSAHRWQNCDWSGCWQHHAWCGRQFCYLGHMSCSDGGCDSATGARCCVAWEKFRKLLSVLISRHLTPRIHGKYTKPAFIRQCSMVAKRRDQRICCNDYAMICWICGIKDMDETPSASLLQKLGIEDITSVLRCLCLRWYGHVPLATSCIKSITNFPALERKEGLGRHGLNVWRLMSMHKNASENIVCKMVAISSRGRWVNSGWWYLTQSCGTSSFNHLGVETSIFWYN